MDWMASSGGWFRSRKAYFYIRRFVEELGETWVSEVAL